MIFHTKTETFISAACYSFIAGNLILGAYLLVFDLPTLTLHSREDTWTEYSGFSFLFITGVMLLLTAWNFRKSSSSHALKYGGLFLAAALAFFWAAGEEISWGQRIWDFTTPDYLKAYNRQQEFNFHNLNTKMFNKSLEHANLLMILLPTLLLFKKIRTLLGIPVPNLLLVFSLQMALGYEDYLYPNPHHYISMFCLLFWIGLLSRQRDFSGLGLALLTLALIMGTGVLNHTYADQFYTDTTREVREYLLSAICLAYALILYFFFRNKTSIP